MRSIRTSPSPKERSYSTVFPSFNALAGTTLGSVHLKPAVSLIELDGGAQVARLVEAALGVVARRLVRRRLVLEAARVGALKMDA